MQDLPQMSRESIAGEYLPFMDRKKARLFLQQRHQFLELRSNVRPGTGTERIERLCCGCLLTPEVFTLDDTSQVCLGAILIFVRRHVLADIPQVKSGGDHPGRLLSDRYDTHRSGHRDRHGNADIRERRRRWIDWRLGTDSDQRRQRRIDRSRSASPGENRRHWHPWRFLADGDDGRRRAFRRDTALRLRQFKQWRGDGQVFHRSRRGDVSHIHQGQHIGQVHAGGRSRWRHEHRRFDHIRHGGGIPFYRSFQLLQRFQARACFPRPLARVVTATARIIAGDRSDMMTGAM